LRIAYPHHERSGIDSSNKRKTQINSAQQHTCGNSNLTTRGPALDARKKSAEPDMNYSLRVSTETPYSVTYPEVLPGSIPQLANQKPDQLLRYFGPLQTLKRVSGRLSRFLKGQEKVEEQRRQRLLVVDDEESIRFSMKEYFSHHGFDVETASDLAQAEMMVKEHQYEVVIQDLRLGAKDANGLDMIKLVHERFPDTRIIVLTAYGSTEVESEAKASGADAFLRKPQPLSQIAQVVRGLIESPRRWAFPQH